MKGTERKNGMAGTEAYLPPEIINLNSNEAYKVLPKHDVWAVAILL